LRLNVAAADQQRDQRLPQSRLGNLIVHEAFAAQANITMSETPGV
jgi:hypothetical protein